MQIENNREEIKLAYLTMPCRMSGLLWTINRKTWGRTRWWLSEVSRYLRKMARPLAEIWSWVFQYAKHSFWSLHCDIRVISCECGRTEWTHKTLLITTNSANKSRSWLADSRSASSIFYVFYETRRFLPVFITAPTLSKMNPIHTLTSYSKEHFNIIFPSTPNVAKMASSFQKYLVTQSFPTEKKTGRCLHFLFVTVLFFLSFWLSIFLHNFLYIIYSSSFFRPPFISFSYYSFPLTSYTVSSALSPFFLLSHSSSSSSSTSWSIKLRVKGLKG
jgi:hypothetical protein